jgi:hypothetical protein
MAIINKKKQLIEIKIYYTEMEIAPGVTKINIIDGKDAKLEIEEHNKNLEKYKKDLEDYNKRKEANTLLENEKAPEKPKLDLLTLNTKWRTMDFATSLEIQESTVSTNYETNRYEVNIHRRSLMLLSKSLAEWDIRDEEGQAVPINEYNIGQLPTEVAEALLQEYENVVNIKPERKKK